MRNRSRLRAHYARGLNVCVGQLTMSTDRIPMSTPARLRRLASRI